MAAILAYNFDQKTLTKLRVLTIRCGAALKAVSRNDYGKPLLALLKEGGEAAGTEPVESFSDRMLVLCGMNTNTEDAFLTGLRTARLSAGVLKAVLTDSNQNWDSLRLHKELCAERDAIQNGGRAH